LRTGTERVDQVVPLFAPLLSIPLQERYAPLLLSPAQQRRQTFAAFLEQFERLAYQQPLLFVFEDLHWADATSLELLHLVADRIRNLPVLMVFTFRPDFEPRWAGLHNASVLVLRRLGEPDIRAMVTQIVGRILPMEVMEAIVKKTDGIPLFVEELTKAVLEAGILVEEVEGYRLKRPLPAAVIPTTWRW
jgi:predicted ATPase